MLKLKRLFISTLTVILAIACVGCAYIDPKPAGNNNITTDSDSNSKETDYESQPDKDALTEAEIEKYTKYKSMYYYSTFGYRFETNETVPVDKLMDFFLFYEFLDESYDVNKKYTEYNTEPGNAMACHLIPVGIVNSWLEEHFAVKIDYTASRYLDGNGNYKIAQGGRGGPIGKLIGTSKTDDGIVLMDVIGGSVDGMYYDYLEIAVKETEDDYQYLYCRDNAPKTALTSDDALKILKNTLDYPDNAVLAIKHKMVTPHDLNDEVYCSIMPYITSGDPAGMPEGSFYRTESTPLYVSLETGKVYIAVYEPISSLRPTEFVEYHNAEMSLTAQNAMDAVKSSYENSKDINVFECILPLYEHNGNYYYHVLVYTFDDSFSAHENGYIPTTLTQYYVSIEDGKIYSLKYNSVTDSNYMKLYE
jgi:hypothetical protein